MPFIRGWPRGHCSFWYTWGCSLWPRSLLCSHSELNWMVQSSKRSRSDRAKWEPSVNGWILARYKISFLMMFPGNGQKQGENKDISNQGNAGCRLRPGISASRIAASKSIPFIRGGIRREDLERGSGWRRFSSLYLCYLEDDLMPSAGSNRSFWTEEKTAQTRTPASVDIPPTFLHFSCHCSLELTQP